VPVHVVPDEGSRKDGSQVPGQEAGELEVDNSACCHYCERHSDFALRLETDIIVLSFVLPHLPQRVVLVRADRDNKNG
jgi:hypothetical protein